MIDATRAGLVVKGGKAKRPRIKRLVARSKARPKLKRMLRLLLGDFLQDGKMAKPKKIKLTDAERHKRFVKMAREVGAEETQVAFECVFSRVVKDNKKKRKR